MMKGRFNAQVHSCTMLLLLLVAGANRISAGSLACYWGQNGNEDTLAAACASGDYNIMMISFLHAFGNGQTPSLNFAGHCDASSGGSSGLVSEVDSCQSQGVKVILSLGGGSNTYGFSTAQQAQDLAQYLSDNFLGSPLGAAHLDGIDLDIESGVSQYYPNMISSLRDMEQNNNYKKLYITAAPQCPFPDAMLGPGDGTALSTQLVDFVFIQFYNNFCGYPGGLDQMVANWNQWTGAMSTAQVFLGLPASPNAAGSGYVDVNTLTTAILPQI